MRDLGKIIILIGLGTIVIGFIIYFTGDKLKWIGQLPGDIRIQKPGFSLYMPITSMILLSILLSLIIWLFRKFGG